MSIGEALRSARNAAGLGIEELSERTRIRPHVIAAIERDDFQPCGGDCYARGHLRTLARVLGLSPEGLLGRYDAEFGGRRDHRVEEVFACRRSPHMAERPRVRWRLLMTGAAAVGATAVSAHVFMAAPESSEPGSRLRVSSTEVSEPRASHSCGGQAETGEEGGAEGSENGGEQAAEVTLTVRAEERTWLRVRDAAGSDVFTGVLEGGETAHYRDEEELRVSLDNADGVVVEANDEEQDGLGGPGGVARFTVARDGVHPDF